MEVNKYQAFVLRGLSQRKEKTTRSMDPANFLLGLAGEVGELINAFKHEVLWPDTGDGRMDKTISEAGDVLWYVTALLSVCGLKVEDVLQQNMDKLTERYGDLSGYQEFTPSVTPDPE